MLGEYPLSVPWFRRLRRRLRRRLLAWAAVAVLVPLVGLAVGALVVVVVVEDALG